MGKIQYFPLNTKGKDYAVGDIHGCFGQMRQDLATFFDSRVDRLFAVGDLVDRGPDSEGAEIWLDLPWFFSVRGNHDDMAARWPAGNMDGANYKANGGYWNLRRPLREQLKTAAAMEALPLAIEVETVGGLVGIVHAECGMESWADFRAALLEFHSLNRVHREVLEGVAMWSRERITSRSPTPVVDVRAVVCGHTPVPQATCLGNVHYIDTGACFGHRFTFMDLATLTPFQVKRNVA